MPKPKIVIIGAGISGLSCAWKLHQAGIETHVLESAPEVGGSIKTLKTDGFLVELGPNSYTQKPETKSLALDCGLSEALMESLLRDNERYLFDGMKLQECPTGPGSMVKTSLLSFSAKFRLLKEPFISKRPPADESIAAFFRRHFGPEVLDMFVAPFVSGIYAGDPEVMSMPAAFPLISDFASRKGSIIRGAVSYMKEIKKKRKKSGEPKKKREPSALCSFQEGLLQFPKTISKTLGENVHCGTKVQKIENSTNPETGKPSFKIISKKESGEEQVCSADIIVMAAPSHEGSKILKESHPKVSKAMGEIPYTPLTIVHVGLSLETVSFKPKGFGFLVPKKKGVRALGVLWTSSVFNNRAPEGHCLMTMFYGGATDPKILGDPESEIFKIAREDLFKTMGWSGKEVFSKITKYEKALPSYNLGHLDRVGRIESAAKDSPAPIHFVGNYLRGISLPDCVKQGIQKAEFIISQLEKEK